MTAVRVFSEITDHVGYEKHDATGRGSGNSRNGTRAKTVLTDVGPVECPRDVAGTFEPHIKKRQRRLTVRIGHGAARESDSPTGRTVCAAPKPANC